MKVTRLKMCKTNKTNKANKQTKGSESRKTEDSRSKLVWTIITKKTEVEIDEEAEEELEPLYSRMGEIIITIKDDEE